MNNYLMCGRLLKGKLKKYVVLIDSFKRLNFKVINFFIATYIPPEKQHIGFFAGKPWTAKIYPGLTNRIKELKKNESPISVQIYKKNVRRSLKQLSALEEKLKSKGVNVKFKPADVPT